MGCNYIVLGGLVVISKIEEKVSNFSETLGAWFKGSVSVSLSTNTF